MKNRRASEDFFKDFAPISFGLIIIIGFFSALGLLLTMPYPADNKELITSLIETLKNILIMAVSYYFGTTASGKRKDETISDIAKMPAPALLPVAPINIQNAESVKNETKEGDINVDSKPKETIIQPEGNML